MNKQSFRTIQAAIEAGSLTCEQVVRHYLDQIEQQQTLNIYVEVFAEEAIARAQFLDQKYRTTPQAVGRLYGMVISIKDVICYRDHQVTAASKILEGFTSLFTATALQRLLDEDVIIIGRVNCDQFAMGSSNENSCYGPTRNAADPERVPGGSSGGSAVSVQADTCLASLGSDTGGSVRQPAGFCGLVGMKPSYGRISRYGLLAYASSFDQIGTLTHTVEDAALLLEIMAGPDEFDSTAIQQTVPSFTKQLDQAADGKKRIAYFDTAFPQEGMHPDIRTQSMNLIQRLQKEGHQVEAVDFAYLDYMIPAYYVLTTAEASSNLSRYDGIRYGRRSSSARNLLETYHQSRTEGFGTEVKRRIMLGTFVLSSGYYDAYYTKAQKIRRLVAERTLEILKTYDFILMPTSPDIAWRIDSKTDDPIAVYLADVYTVQANMAGIPAIALPLGQSTEGMPIGIQLMANKYQEGALFQFAQSTLALLHSA
ncbi:MAG: Asp-tRNA(Asn)/Glu-tRNA(Gln) amidotransferase subunit GatA [Bacteroidota bacterium]